jgi:predicted DNA binding CopG/RHH family protein
VHLRACYTLGMETINIRLDKKTHRKLKIRAAKEGLNYSELIEHLLKSNKEIVCFDKSCKYNSL